MKVIYVTGWGRSGSSILSNILGQLTGVFSAGEVRYIGERGILSNRLCGCGSNFNDCDFWSQVLEEAFGPQKEKSSLYTILTNTRIGGSSVFYTLVPFGKRMLRGKHSEYLIALGKLYAAVSKISGEEIIVDTSKLPVYGYLLRFVPGIDLHTVHLVRDPRAVAFSWRRKKLLENAGGGIYIDRHSLLKSGLQWSLMNHLSEKLLAQHGRYTRIKYENFVLGPETELSGLLKMMEINTGLLPIENGNEVKMGVHHTVSGNPSRFETGKIKLKLDDEWKTSMKPWQKMLVSILTFPVVKRYGYFEEK